ncbi:MAG: ATP-dependent metallopeptidase FtsH/Yme1/Tma family protein, partial [Actinomycetota bacterium]
MAEDSKGEGAKNGSGRREQGWPRWSIWVLIGVVLASLALPTLFASDDGTSIEYTEFLDEVRAGRVDTFEFNNTNGRISGEFTDEESFSTTGPLEFSEA